MRSRYEYFLKEYPFQAAVRNGRIWGFFAKVGTDVFPALRERGMNAIFSGVRLYLGGITIIRLSSYVQDVEPFLVLAHKNAPRGCAARGVEDVAVQPTRAHRICRQILIRYMKMEENYVQQS